jgi:DNA-binding transcriptional regulator YiaG
MMTDGSAAAERIVAEDDRLVWVIRGMAPGEFTRRFRDGLPTAALLQVVAALPSERLDELAKRAHRSGSAASSRRPRSREDGADRPLATAIRVARQQADLPQVELAERLGIRQSSVSQWERGATEPTGRRLLELMGELPGLGEILKEMSGLQVVSGRLEPDSSTDGSSGQP